MRRVSVSSLCYVGHLYQLPSLTAQSWGTSQRGGREEHEKRGGRKNVSNLEKKRNVSARGWGGGGLL